jgi:hypothetical protein
MASGKTEFVHCILSFWSLILIGSMSLIREGKRLSRQTLSCQRQEGKSNRDHCLQAGIALAYEPERTNPKH